MAAGLAETTAARAATRTVVSCMVAVGLVVEDLNGDVVLFVLLLAREVVCRLRLDVFGSL